MRILIVDDSALIRSILKGILATEERMTVVAEGTNGMQALTLNRNLEPDLIIMDIQMPVMDGLAATRRIMAENPTPILIFSNELDAGTGYEALNSGAVEVIRKPDMDQFNEPAFQEGFFRRIRAAAASKVLPKPNPQEGSAESVSGGRGFKLLVIGASTGGPLAVKAVLQHLPANFPLGIALVQHMEAGFDQGYARWLNDFTPLTVRLAGTEEPVCPGVVCIAPVDHHLIVRGDRLVLNEGPKVLNQKPSVDMLFSSAAESYGDRLIGVLLTGMGKDGADGCAAIVSRQGVTLVQDEASSAIFGMPKAAIERGAATRILPLDEIPEHLFRLAGVKHIV